jgi:hypothetical protein
MKEETVLDDQFTALDYMFPGPSPEKLLDYMFPGASPEKSQ